MRRYEVSFNRGIKKRKIIDVYDENELYLGQVRGLRDSCGVSREIQGGLSEVIGSYYGVVVTQ